MKCTIPTIEIAQYGNRFEHKLEVKEAEFILRHFMGNPMGWGAATVAIRESLIGKQYLLPGHGHFTDYSRDFILAYKNMSLQARITIWAIVVFGSSDVLNVKERAYRNAEESLELGQTCGMTKDDWYKLIDYVYDRPVGEFHQEVGGAFTTLAVLCSVNDHDMVECAERELANIWNRIDIVREKQKRKPHATSPLPGQPEDISDFTNNGPNVDSDHGKVYVSTTDVVAIMPVPEGETVNLSWLNQVAKNDFIKAENYTSIPVEYNGPSLADTPHAIEALTLIKGEKGEPIMAVADECVQGTLAEDIRVVYTKDDCSKAFLDMVEKHTFIKQVDLIAWTSRYWAYSNIDTGAVIKGLIKDGQLKAFDYVHGDTPSRIRTMLYPAKVNINILLGAE